MAETGGEGKGRFWVDSVSCSFLDAMTGIGAGLGQHEMMKVREIIALLEKDGWHLVATRGSHRQYKHPSKLGRVTVAGKPGDDVARGTLNSILKQAGLKETR